MTSTLDLYEPDGMSFLPMRDPQGRITSSFSRFVILERKEKKTEDNSSLRWFPHVITRQRVTIQVQRCGGTSNGAPDGNWENYGDPEETWIPIPEESYSMPFNPEGR